MIEVKQALLAALADALDEVAPGRAPGVVAFESPKQASHGDLACTAAMQLARPLKKNPRELAQALVAALRRRPAVERWVESLDIAGPGFINLTLRPAARQSVVAEVLHAGAGFGRGDAQAGRKAIVEFVSANPTGPLHVGHGRQAALGDALCNLFESQGWQVTREFYYNDAGVQIATLAASVQARLRGFAPGDAGWPESAYNGDYIADIAADYAAGRTVEADDRATTASGDADDLDAIRRFAVAYLRREQDLDLQAFGVRFDSYLPRIGAVLERPRRRHGGRAGGLRPYLRGRRRALAAHHRLGRRQGPGDAQVVAGRRRRGLAAIPISFPTWPTTWSSSSAASSASSTSRAATITAPSPACAPACRRSASAFPRAFRSTCCTRW